MINISFKNINNLLPMFFFLVSLNALGGGRTIRIAEGDLISISSSIECVQDSSKYYRDTAYVKHYIHVTTRDGIKLYFTKKLNNSYGFGVIGDCNDKVDLKRLEGLVTKDHSGTFSNIASTNNGDLFYRESRGNFICYSYVMNVFPELEPNKNGEYEVLNYDLNHSPVPCP